MPATKLDRNRRRDPLKELLFGRLKTVGWTAGDVGEYMSKKYPGWGRSSAYKKLNSPRTLPLDQMLTVYRHLGVTLDELRQAISY